MEECISEKLVFVDNKSLFVDSKSLLVNMIDRDENYNWPPKGASDSKIQKKYSDADTRSLVVMDEAVREKPRQQIASPSSLTNTF